MRYSSAFVLLSLLSPTTASAANLIYDFESPWEFEDWNVSNPAVQTVVPSQQFAVSGDHSAAFVAPASPTPPEFRLPLWWNDWERYNRLALDLTNPTDQEIRLEAFAGNERNGFGFELVLPPLTHRRHIVDLEVPSFIRKNNILAITFKAPADQEIAFHLDNITLLTPEDLPTSEQKKKLDAIDDPALMYANQTQTMGTPEKLVAELAAHRTAVAKEKIASLRAEIPALELNLPGAEDHLEQNLQSLEDRIAKAEDDAWAQIALIEEINRLRMTAHRFAEVRDYVSQYDKETAGGFVVGFADPMRKIMPKHHLTGLNIADGVELSLAGGEKEAFQVAVVPFAKDASQVTVSMSELAGPDGNVLSDNDVELMGYVETKMRTEPNVEYVGWYPDPIIPTDDAVDVKQGDVQTWWVRVRAPKDQAAGTYTGTLTVSAEGQPPLTFDVSVRVYDFDLPPHAPIPTAITYIHRDWLKNHNAITEESWEKVKYKHADFLADYLINMDDIYRSNRQGEINSVDWDIIKYLHDKNQLVAFNIGGFHSASDEAMEAFRPNYEKAKELGVLDHAYTYGYDERPAEDYPRIQAASERIRELYPELLIMTTAQDHSYGFDSVVESLTAWCPIISRFNPDLADKAREAGKTVWWYTCIWPPRPYPNIFVDYPAVDNRILVGWMTAKYKPDGYLYYHTTIHRNPDGLSTWPYTDWNPNSYGDTNGDGSYFCFDTEGNPIGTIRVENYRDGLEDLAYFMILEHKLKLARAAGTEHQEWISEAETALADNDKLIRSRTDWTEDPTEIYAYRARLADLIERSPIEDDNPWKGGMGVRGLPRD